MELKINWSDFPIFLAVVNAGNLSGAARDLGLSQPTVSRRMNALEEQMGIPLLQKTNTGIAPTEMGLAVLDHIRRMEHEAEAITRATAASDQSLAGTVTISATQGVGDMWLPEAMRPFHVKYPEIEFIIDVNIQMANLAKREADIALRWMGPGNQNSLIGRKVITLGIGLYASKCYLEKHGCPKTLEQLADHSAVGIRMSRTSPLWPINLNDLSIVPQKISFLSNSLRTQEEAIASGYGIGALAHLQAERQDGLVRVLPDFEHLQDLWIVAHDDLSKNRRIRLVFDFLIKVLQKDQEYFLTGKSKKSVAL